MSARGWWRSARPEVADDEAQSLRGVVGTSVRLVEDRDRTLTVAVAVGRPRRGAEVRRALEDRVVVHARQAVDDPEVTVDVELRPGRRSGSRGLR